MNKEVLVIIGTGGIGLAIARRQGPGRALVLADFNAKVLDAAATDLRTSGNEVTTQHVDVADPASVKALAEAAAKIGPVMQVVHTAGLSPNMAGPARVLAVDLMGTAIVLEEFGKVIAPGGAGVVISSMAGYMPPPLPPEQDNALANTPADQLLQLQILQPSAVADSGVAYGLAKRANHLRVQAEAVLWGERGARVNSISPGIIATPLAQEEMASDRGPAYRAMISASPAKRVGTPEEVAAAAAYLLGSDGAFITGSDLLIDGGVIAALRAGRIQLSG